MEEAMPEAYAELARVFELLERHYRDMQDIEFTVQQGKLWMLQTRSGKRTATAALKLAVDMAGEGLIDEKTAILRVDPMALDQLLHPTLDPKAARDVLTTGLPASPGAASGKIVLDAGNPNPRRDGESAAAAVARGAGLATQEHLPGARIVRAFNQLNNKVFLSEAHRAGEKLAVPLGGDDAEALAVASRLVTDAGFEPVIVGSLAQSKAFDSSAPIFLKAMTARELRAALNLPPGR